MKIFSIILVSSVMLLLDTISPVMTTNCLPDTFGSDAKCVDLPDSPVVPTLIIGSLLEGKINLRYNYCKYNWLVIIYIYTHVCMGIYTCVFTDTFGEHCADGTECNGSPFSTSTNAVSFDDCKSKCLDAVNCRGFDWSNGRIPDKCILFEYCSLAAKLDVRACIIEASGNFYPRNN